MKIRNPHPVRHLVPALAIEADPGEEVRVPAGTPVPDGWEIVGEPHAAKKKSEPAARVPDDNEKENN